MASTAAGCVAKRARVAASLPKISRREQVDTDHASDIGKIDYYFANGLRHVIPYAYTYRATAKSRWFRRPLLDICTQEFGRKWSRDYFEGAIRDGRIRVVHQEQGLRPDLTGAYLLQELDSIQHDTHRHEPAVLGSIVNIVHETDDFVVVDKPGSIPVHACTNYRHNSLAMIMEKELGVRLYSTHGCAFI